MSQETRSAGFRRLLDFLAETPDMWINLFCPESVTGSGPPYDDVVPSARTLVERFPDRVLWGTGWPHPNMSSHMPDDGELIDLIPQIGPTEELRQRLLVGNPVRLYWPEEAGG